MAVKRYSTFPRAPELELTIRCSLMSYPGYLLVGSHPTAEMYSTAQTNWATGHSWWGAYLSVPTGQHSFVGVLSHCRDANWSTGHLLGGGEPYPCTAPANWATGHLLGWREPYPLQRCSRCISQPQPTVPQDTYLRGGALPPSTAPDNWAKTETVIVIYNLWYW